MSKKYQGSFAVGSKETLVKLKLLLPLRVRNAQSSLSNLGLKWRKRGFLDSIRSVSGRWPSILASSIKTKNTWPVTSVTGCKGILCKGTLFLRFLRFLPQNFKGDSRFLISYAIWFSFENQEYLGNLIIFTPKLLMISNFDSLRIVKWKMPRFWRKLQVYTAREWLVKWRSSRDSDAPPPSSSLLLRWLLVGKVGGN